jgi:hypothetical protein
LVDVFICGLYVRFGCLGLRRSPVQVSAYICLILELWLDVVSVNDTIYLVLFLLFAP